MKRQKLVGTAPDFEYLPATVDNPSARVTESAGQMVELLALRAVAPRAAAQRALRARRVPTFVPPATTRAEFSQRENCHHTDSPALPVTPIQISVLDSSPPLINVSHMPPRDEAQAAAYHLASLVVGNSSILAHTRNTSRL